MFKSRPPSRTAARHEALARDIRDIHAGESSAVYGYRKVWRELIGKGWDPLKSRCDYWDLVGSSFESCSIVSCAPQ